MKPMSIGAVAKEVGISVEAIRYCEKEDARRASIDSPEHVRRYGSPTILVDGEDVLPGEAPAAMSCKIYRDDSGIIARIWRARARRGYGPLILGSVAATLHLLGKFAFDSNTVQYSAVPLLACAAV